MDENQISYDDLPAIKPGIKRRRNLLPWWIIACIWLFLIFLAVVPVGVVFGLLNFDFQISLLGLSTNDPFSAIGLFLIALFIFKGITAFGLWTEKVWAVDVAKIDAIISIVICCLTMGYSLFALHTFTIRLELILITLYYLKMNNIEYDWKNFDYPSTPPGDPDSVEIVN